MAAVSELRSRRTGLKWLAYCAGSAFNGHPAHVDDQFPTPDPEITPPPEMSQSDIPVPARSPPFFTPNILRRVLYIVLLSGLGGVSLVPAEHRVPKSLPWVLLVVFITNVVAWTTAIDVLCPERMIWYFNKPVPVPPLKSLINSTVDNVTKTPSTNHAIPTNAQSTDTGEDVGQTSEEKLRLNGLELIAGFALTAFGLVKLAFYQSGFALGLMDLVYLVSVSFVLYWIKKFEHLKWRPCCTRAKHWIFHENYLQPKYIEGCGRGIQSVVKVLFLWASWWWIAFRLTSVVKIIRNRNDPHVHLQFVILMCGMAAEVLGIAIFFLSYPICWIFGWRWRKELWMSHLIDILAMALLWLAVIVTGFNTSSGEPCILLPCTQEFGSTFCKVMITYIL